ncbi:cytidylate kinase [Lachnospiraceae bacterium PM6-15]|uniref:Helix-turn-helix domain-containing protein n=1 Tax=Ohessyouella blattaphilus TaxID=2949333 RepID=A0ABT1EIA5_9FIRM|nr:hypothetical protein [Ohessyouella blattaphilus]MCP1109497.1 hypothetical protein [Ohessyouella blattaphilus]MCR8562891.1 hypothetical protein [Ohessyouella blattaphilus]
MKKTSIREITDETVTVTMEEFINLIGAGRYTAHKIVDQAEAKIYIGRRVLVNMERVKRYLNEISE